MLTEKEDKIDFLPETPLLISHVIDDCLAKHLEEWEQDNYNVPKTLYHYTNIDTFYKIIENREFWATHIEYLNDKSELQYSFDLLKKIAIELREKYSDNNSTFFLNKLIETKFVSSELSDWYTICFSECEDKLSQWRGYGAKYKSICIGLDSSSFCQPSINKLSFKPPLKIIYNSKLQEERITCYLIDYLMILSTHRTHSQFNIDIDTNKRITDLLKMLLIRLKHPSWHEENEWRIVYFDDLLYYDKNGQWEKDEFNNLRTVKEDKCFRPTDIALVPFLKRNPFGDGIKIKISEVIIPQSEYQFINKKALEWFLSQNGYDIINEVKVWVSDIPINY